MIGHALAEGIFVGLALAVLIGPAFFTLIQTSIHRGFHRGAMLAFGIALSDLALVLLCYLGATQILVSPTNHVIFGFIGGLILIVFGIYTFTRKKVAEETAEMHFNNPPGFLTFFIKGFLLNIANPFIWIFWITIVLSAGSSFNIDTKAVYAFFIGTLGTALLTDLIKCYIANKIKRLLTYNLMHYINLVVGVLLTIFGVVLIGRVINENWTLIKSFLSGLF